MTPSPAVIVSAMASAMVPALDLPADGIYSVSCYTDVSGILEAARNKAAQSFSYFMVAYESK